MRYLLFVVFNLALVIILQAQTAQLKGTVIDAATGEALIGASVVIKGTTNGTTTDFDGNYIISKAPVGNQTIQCSYISYKTEEVSIKIEAEATFYNFKLATSDVELGEVVKRVKITKETESATLLEQKRATIIQENLGSVEMSRKGISNVAAGVKKIAGVSMVGSKQLFVRGLGDRYNSAQLNCLPISSPDPTKKVVKLDLFPSEIVKVLGVSKVYCVQNYADYTGALINIETKDYPEDAFVSIDAGMGYNTNVTGKKFRQSDAPDGRFLGLNINERKQSLPSELKNFSINQRYTDEKFSTSFAYNEITAQPAISLSLSGGKLFKIKNQKLGVLATMSFDNDYELRDRYKASLNRHGNVIKSFDNTDYTYSTNSSAMISLTWMPNTVTTLAYTILYSGSGDDRLSEKEGRDRENNHLFVRYYQFENHQLLYNILRGDHKFDSPLSLSWALGYANTESNIPDRRSSVLVNRNDNWYYFSLNQQETMRFFSELNENDINASAKFQYKLNNEKGNIIAGTQARRTQREFAPYTYYYNISAISGQIVNTEDSYKLIESAFNNDEIYINSGSRISDKYEGTNTIAAGYANVIYNLTKKLTFDVGIRAEHSTQVITKYSFGGTASDVELQGLDFFPACNFKYELTEKSNLRVAASRTITRPSFNERSPSKIQAEVGEEMIYGNPELINSFSNNVDIKYEIFPHKEELISLAAYYKQLIDPIELTSEKSGGLTQYTFKNTPEGSAAGVEFEIKKKFGFIISGLNAAYIYTHVQLPDSAMETTKSRALQGASPYLVNADLGVQFKYGKEKKNTISASILYNIKGRTIWAVGADGIGNAYELPVNNFDIIIQSKLNNGLKFSLKAKNIFDSEIIKTQDVYEDNDTGSSSREEVYERYKKGISFSFGLSYTF